jgi:hypothetical protein
MGVVPCEEVATAEVEARGAAARAAARVTPLAATAATIETEHDGMGPA